MIHLQIIEIKSPRPLISTLTIKNLHKLEGAHESINSIMARVFKRK
jgi:hypothetical protein